FRRLVAGRDLELLDALDGRRHHAGRRTSRSTPTAITIAWRIDRIVTRHVVAIVAAIELEAVLVRGGSGDVARERHAYLQHRERGCIAPEVRQQLELVVMDSR